MNRRHETQGRVDVLAVMASETVSGPGRQLAGIACALRSAGIRMRVLLLWRQGNVRPALADFLADAGVDCELIPDHGPLDRSIIGALENAVAQSRARIIQTHGYKATAAVYAMRRRGTRPPWVGFFHGHTRETLRARFYHFLDRWLLGSADRIVVMSGRQRHQFRRYDDRVRVIHNAIVSMPASSPGDAERLLEQLRALSAPIIGVVGRLSREKGVDVFIRACALLVRRGTSFTAVVAGDGPERPVLEALAESSGLADRVVFLGHVRAADTLYRALHLLVIPSRSEGLPNVLLEAISADLGVVATSVGAIPDVLDSPESGRLVPPESEDDLADAIEAALRDRTDPARSAAGARVKDRFSLENRLEQHLELYRSLVPDIGEREPARQ